MDELDRKAILMRRARFVAAAMTAAGLSGSGGCGRNPEPQGCLAPEYPESVVEVPRVDAAAEPVESDDDAGSVELDAGTGLEPPPDATTRPRICLDFVE